MIVIGIDNGVTGTIALLGKEGEVVFHRPMPTRSEQSYTKTKQNITRIDWFALFDLLTPWKMDKNVLVIIERPMTGVQKKIKAMFSAMRALESTLVVMEMLGLRYQYIDSKEWQKAMLPKGTFFMKKNKAGRDMLSGPGSKELKKAACDIARRLFPDVKTKDADSLIMAEYIRRTHK